MEPLRIPLSRPDIGDEERKEVLAVLDTPWLSMGPKVEAFERQFAAVVGARHAVAVSSGTAGLHLALRAVGVGAGDEVLTTPFTFVATANVVLMERARPVFVDVDPQTLNLDPATVEAHVDRAYAARDGTLVHRVTGAPLRAILPVAVFGHPVDMDGFARVRDRCGLPIVHDACEALGSRYWSAAREAWVSEAALADAAVYAFYPNKQITTGEGGMVVTSDDGIARACRVGRNQGRDPDAEWLAHETLGFNYRMDELSAALGLAQLRRLPILLARRRQVAAWYDARLADVPEVVRPAAAPWAEVSWFVYVIRLPSPEVRDAALRHLLSRGIGARPYFPAVHLFRHLRALGYAPGDFPVAEAAALRGLALPFFPGLTQEEVDHVVRTLKEALALRAAV